MTKVPIASLQQLIEEVIFPFYRVERHTPLRFQPGRWENDAEHSWSLALIAAALAPHIDPTLDIGKICQFATVHDLVEVYAGDTSNFATESEKATKDKREAAALKKLESNLRALPWITKTITEYERQDMPEARFVKATDKLIPILYDYIEEGQFYHEEKITIESWREQLQAHRQKAQAHPGVFEYYDEVWRMLETNPHFFHK